mgnify:CR=1 FL=1
MNPIAWRASVPAGEGGQPLDAWIANKARLTKNAVQIAFREKRVLQGKLSAKPDSKTVVGQVVVLMARRDVMAQAKREALKANPPPPKPVPVLKIVYQDEDLVIVDKPSGLTTNRNVSEVREFGDRAKKFLPDTVADLLPTYIPRLRDGRTRQVFPIHRTDKETSGLLVFGLNSKAAKYLAKAFKDHAVDRAYLALTRNTPQPGRIENRLIDDRGDGRRGSGPDGEPAITTVEVVESHAWGSMIRCVLDTGRTHQVRIHLGEMGTPLCGEKIYDRPLHGKPLPDPSGAARLMLHAARLGFYHPTTGNMVLWESEPPADFQEVLERMRKGPIQPPPRRIPPESRKRRG